MKPDLHVHVFESASQVALESVHVQTSLEFAVFVEPDPQIAQVYESILKPYEALQEQTGRPV